MRKHKTKIIIAVVIIAVLAGAWIYDGSLRPDTGAGTVVHVAAVAVEEAAQSETVVDTENGQTDQLSETYQPIEYASLRHSELAPYTGEVDETKEASYTEEMSYTDETTNAEETANAEETSITEEAPYTEEVTETNETSPEYLDPPPPEAAYIGDGYFYVTLTVRVDMILLNMHMLNVEKHELVPNDGVIFPVTRVRVYEGESVFNILQREMRRARIHMASRFTPIFNSAYVEAINNLYEFDVGPLSGWMYSVNGWFPNFGASRYLLSPGDVIEWHFTVDLGRDLGVHWIEGGQRDE